MTTKVISNDRASMIKAKMKDAKMIVAIRCTHLPNGRLQTADDLFQIMPELAQGSRELFNPH